MSLVRLLDVFYITCFLCLFALCPVYCVTKENAVESQRCVFVYLFLVSVSFLRCFIHYFEASRRTRSLNSHPQTERSKHTLTLYTRTSYSVRRNERLRSEFHRDIREALHGVKSKDREKDT